MAKIISLSVLLFISFSHIVCANDSSVGEDNGSLEFLQQNEVSIVKERLLIAPDRINVDYIFFNHAAQDIVVPVAFPMPAIYKIGMEDHATGIANFKISVDGKPVKSESRWRVIRFREDRREEDITAKVLATGWTLAQLRNAFTSDAPVENFYEKGMPHFPEEWFDDGRLAIAVQQYFLWQQRFPAGKEVTIHHSYSPSFSSTIPFDLKTILEYSDNAFTPATRTALKQLDAKLKTSNNGNIYPYAIYTRTLAYILKTGANWKDGTIDDFTLRIHKLKKDDVVVPGFNYPLKQIDPLTLEFKKKNFKPTENLYMTFYSGE
ncbi:DUF4424 domain-containing protein [Salmonella enterica]|nr:DUF4424 domain-containing protein [Salmonella enterica]